ncbi:MAG: hypothetical protein A3D31_07795 [Candidatus Fluviicola riflensis]|nr:MAG: hypothetical protein CHH17_07215 [Candidatus Fluviicola riflensis]OGS79845.1 MAG: hypothetical protein A3D31_07795 [Candidatus Fluviicola riflensis]OGS82360.1 MAG: hypothetical protein A2724_16740 [Fluviicola sp. RIFCSPHIGHO2_01_FULL_43_53]OGS88024.1 MAG: hypothetical protein A3E30_14175 [Fluviicola sp. RIFCSPHIGHO2_12_FULL_43_24]
MKQLAIVFGCIALFSSCKKETTWVGDWTFPIVDDTLTLNSLVEDSIVYDDNGTTHIRFEESLYKSAVSELITIPDTTVSADISLDVDSYTVQPGSSLYHQFDMVLDLDPVQLTSFKVKSGILKYKARNVIPTNTTFKAEFPYSDKNGATLIASPVASPGTSANPSFITGQVDISGFTFETMGEMQDSINSVFSKLKITTDPAGPPVTITRYDTLYFEVTLEDVVLEAANGFFGNEVIQQSVSTDADFFKNIPSGSFDLSAISLSLSIKNGVDAPAQFKLISLEAIDQNGTSTTLQTSLLNQWMSLDPAQINGTDIDPGIATVVLNEQNSSIIDLIEAKAVTVEADYEVQFNPVAYTLQNEFIENSFIELALEGDVPVNMQLSSLVIDDTLELNVSTIDFSTIEEASLDIIVSNEFEIDATGTFVWLDQYYQPLAISPKTMTIKSADYGTLLNGVLTCETVNSLFFTQEELQLMLGAVYLRLICTLNTGTVETPTFINVPIDAKIGVKAQVKVKKRHHV